MHACRKRSCNFFDVYHWSAGPFKGMVKATWTPHLNYFEIEAGTSHSPTGDKAAMARQSYKLESDGGGI
jgi:hypothetical protein